MALPTVGLDYRLVLDGFADAVVAADGSGRFVYANRAAEDLLGWPEADLLGQPITVIQPARFHAAHHAGFQRYLTTRVPRLIGGRARVAALRRDGAEVDVELALAAFRVGDGQDLFVASLRDLSDRVELERQMVVTRYLRAAGAAGARLAAAPDVDAALRTVVETLVDDLDAALARVWLYDAATDTLDLRASGGLSTATATSSRARIDLATYPYKVGEIARTRRPFVRNGLRDDPQFEQEWVARVGIAAVAGFPLLVGGELRGVLIHFARQPLADEVVETLANFASVVASALHDVELLARERASRQETEAARQRAAFLAEAAGVLAAALDEATILERLGGIIVPALADWCVFDMVEPDGAIRRAVVAHDGADPARAAAARTLAERYPVDPSATDHIVVRVLRSGRPEFAPEVTDATLIANARDPEHLEILRAMGLRSHMLVPMIARGRTLGAVTLITATSGRRYGRSDLALAEELAHRAALAVDNARLVREARAAEERARRHALRLEVLAEASHAFAAASLDLPAVLDVIARRTVEAVGDGCIIRLVSEDGAWFVPAAAHHPNAEAIAFLWEILATTTHPVDEGLVGQVARTGEPLRIPALPPDEMRARLKPEFRPFLDRFGVHSVLCVPLRARGRTIGTLFTWRGEAGDGYTDDDQAFLLALADRAAVAIENARLYREQVQARGRIQELAAERAAVLGQIADGVIIADPEGRIVFVNEAARRLHGVAELGVAVEGYSSTYHLFTLEGQPYPSEELPLARAVRWGETVVNAAWLIRRPDGTEIAAQGSAAPVVAEDGQRLGAVLTLRDATAEREMERQKDEFFAAASHDLKTPLTSIKGWAQLLRQRAEREPGRARDLPAVTAIEEQAAGMHRLIEELLLSTRLRMGQRPELNPTDVELVILAERLVAQFQPLTTGHTLRVVAEGPVAGRWDEGKIEQIVGNLVGNAIKYSPDGGVIEVTVARAGDEARLAVRDEGVGIPAPALPQVFDQFFRVARRGPAAGVRGLGLGLFSAQRLAIQHGGRIEVESEEGRGSAFTLVLPLDASGRSAEGEPSGVRPED